MNRVHSIVMWCCTGLLFSCAVFPEAQRPSSALDGVVGAGNWELMAAAANGVLRGLEKERVVCLSLLGGPADVTFHESVLVGWGEPRVVSFEECPRTYARMIRYADAPADPPPPGHLDPYHMRVGRPQFDGPDHAWIEIELTEGMSRRIYACSVHTALSQAYCRVTRNMVH